MHVNQNSHLALELRADGLLKYATGWLIALCCFKLLHAAIKLDTHTVHFIFELNSFQVTLCERCECFSHFRFEVLQQTGDARCLLFRTLSQELHLQLMWLESSAMKRDT